MKTPRAIAPSLCHYSAQTRPALCPSTTSLPAHELLRHFLKRGVVHHAREVWHAPTTAAGSSLRSCIVVVTGTAAAAAAAELVGEVAELGVVHEALEGGGVGHDFLRHVGEHGVVHDGGQI